MFASRRLHVRYWVYTDDEPPFSIRITLDDQGLLETWPETCPDWTRLDANRCTTCQTAGDHCRPALAIAPVVDAFMHLDSLQHVHCRATMENRVYEMAGPAPQIAASIMGLCMAASGCTATEPFRAMALFHHPFASPEENTIRAAGFALLRHWAHDTLDSDRPFAGLIDAWHNLEEANRRIGDRLHAYCERDASRNGIVNLDMFAKLGAWGLEHALNALKPALLARGL